MKLLFDNVSMMTSKMITRNYSTSFYHGINFLNKRLRGPVYAIYGFVRLADEIVDSFEGYDQRKLLARFREDTYQAIDEGISLNPVLNSFQQVVHEYAIHRDLIDIFLKSMEMDLEKISYTTEKYQQYILGSAEVVGLMCLQVFTEGDKNLYEALKPYAMRLGAAFQKVNFLRDIKADHELLGRIYFPGMDRNSFTGEAKKSIEQEIANDFSVALDGIRQLPASSRGGVYLAYVYYQSLFKKIRNLTPHRVFSERIRINNGEKFRLMINSMLELKMNLL